jgi:hypothetical protein
MAGDVGVMWRRLEDETYLMRLKDGGSFRLLDITNFAAWGKKTWGQANCAPPLFSFLVLSILTDRQEAWQY